MFGHVLPCDLRPCSRAMLLQMLILVLVRARFALMQAKRALTSATAAGFEFRVVTGLEIKAVFAFPLMSAQRVSHWGEDAGITG